jgi:hypothetical protein
VSQFFSQDQFTEVTGVFSDYFDFRAVDVVINKSPIQVISNVASTNEMYGYGEQSTQPSEISYQPVSGVFQCVIVNAQHGNPTDSFKGEARTLKSIISPNAKYLKCRNDCRQFIKNGKTENVIVDDLVYNLDMQEIQQNYFGLKFYYFELKQTL